MRILYAIPGHKKGADIPLMNKEWQDRDWGDALQRMGHELVPFNWEFESLFQMKEWIKNKRQSINRSLVNFVEKENSKKSLDLVFTAADERRMLPETITKIKALGIPIVNFLTDDVHAFHRNETNAPLYTVNWTAQLAAIENYKRVGAPYIYTPLGANPRLYKPYNLEKEFDVTFVGRNIGYREELLQNIFDAGIECRVWGDDWPVGIKQMTGQLAFIPFRHGARGIKKQVSISFWNLSHIFDIHKMFRPRLSFEDMVKMYSRSRVNLNFAGGWDCMMSNFKQAKRSVKLRDFEVPMSGGFYLTEYYEELEGLYDIGREIECFRDVDDMIEKIKYYIENPDEREAVAKAGHKRAVRDYTWEKNFERLFEQLGMKN